MASPRPFAQGTAVDVYKTIGQIDGMLTKAGATHFRTFRSTAREGVEFVFDGVAFRVSVWIPTTEEEARPFAGRKGRMGHGGYREAERARRYRVLHRVVHEKLLSVQEEVYTLAQVFVGDAITKSGDTIAERADEYLRAAVGAGEILAALPAGGA